MENLESRVSGYDWQDGVAQVVSRQIKFLNFVEIDVGIEWRKVRQTILRCIQYTQSVKYGDTRAVRIDCCAPTHETVITRPAGLIRILPFGIEIT